MSEPSNPPPQQPSKTRARLFNALKIVFAVAILFLVVRNVPWTDRAVYTEAGVQRSFSGRILDDWKADRARFAFAEGLDRSTLPEEWQRQLGKANELDLVRSERVDWKPGMPSVFGSVDKPMILAALALLFMGVVATTTRWWRLLAAVGCPTGWFNALRLNLYGLFFNIVVPGLTGGDLIKAVLVAREHPERRAAAAISVLIDRLIGILVLALMGAIVIVFAGEKFAVLRTPVLVALGGGVLLAAMYANPALRRGVRFSHWLARLPMSKSLLQIDEALLVYSKRPSELALAVLFSFWNHLSVVLAIFVLGRAFGDRTLGFVQYVVVTSVGNIVSAIPIAPGGWGVGEAAYKYLFELIGGDGTIGVAVSITFKLLFILIGLSGGVFLLLPGGRKQMSELQAAPTQS